ncbi:hypothetical protein Tco_1147477 [Tanacetum coccineum]
MASTMTTRNAGRRTAATRGGGTSEQDGKECERTDDQVGNGRNGQGSGRGLEQLQNLLPTIVAQVGNHVGNQGNNENQGDNVVNDNIQSNVRMLHANNDRSGCSYKEFLACNLKEYDGKGGFNAVELSDSHMKPRGCCSCDAAYTDRFHELARLVPHLVTPKSKRIERYVYGLAP